VRLVVGLGNPGKRYARTRHNVAWRVLDELAARGTAPSARSEATYHARRTSLGGHEVELLQPLTYMNASGEAFAAWAGEHPLEPAGFLVVTDDVYLPLGLIRLRTGGSSGGHRGLESLEAAIGHPGFARLRIGVGEAEGEEGLREHVLDEFSPEETPVIEAAIRHAADAVECWLEDGMLAAMNRFNRRVRKEDSET
jgi:PTH1 family peptidyl-tRNA hydrolase